MITDLAEVEEAVREGADGILAQSSGNLLPDIANSDDETVARLLLVAEALGGGDIALDIGAEGISNYDPAFLCRLAPFCRLRWLIYPESLPLSVRDLRRELTDIVQAERDVNRTADIPLLMAAHPILSGPDATTDRFDYNEILVAPDTLRNVTFLETLELPSLFVLLPFDLDELPSAIATGITGVVVPPSLVVEAKNQVREQE